MLSINISELIWTVVCFFLLYFLLKRFLYDPIINFMDDRRARIDAKLAQERELLAVRKENEEKLALQLQDSRAAAAALLAESAARDEQRNAELEKQARQSALEERSENKKRVEREAEDAVMAFDVRKEQLAVRLAERLLGGEQ